MSNAPTGLLAFRRAVMSVTGLGAAEVGIVGDGAHARTGGYHEGRDVLVSIGRYHPGDQYIGAAGEDYSARLRRDRTGLTDDASAVDVGDNWPRGGRAAWLRWNRSLVAALHAGDQALAPVRAVNYSPDGTARKRTDREHGWSVIDSTDSVNIHTHVEFYRDSEGRRQACLDRLVALMGAAITGGSVTTQAEASAANASANSWAAVQLLPSYTVPFPNNDPNAKPTTVPGALAVAVEATLIKGAGSAALTDAQVAALGAQVTEALGAELTALRAELTAQRGDVARILAALRAAGTAATPAA